MKKSGLGLGAVMFGLLMSLSVSAGDVIQFPNDTDETIQEAVIRAGCGGTVRLAPGTYSGSVLSNDTSPIVPGLPDIKVGHIFMECGGSLLGSGVDETIIDGSLSPSPALGTPVIGLGFDPFNIHPVTEDYEVSHLTLKTSTTATTPQGLATGWTNDVRLHHLKIEGFNTAIRGDLVNEASIDHVVATGQGPAIGRCIEFRELNFFLPGALPPEGHMAGHSIHHNQLANCLLGINVANTVEASIHHNSIQNTATGIQLRAVQDLEVHHNVIEMSSSRGVNLINASQSSFHHNTYCQNAIDFRLGPSTLPSLLGLPPSGNILIYNETFLGAGADFVDDDPNDTGVTSDGNTSIAGGACPAL